MAARERKSAVNKQLNKEIQADGEKTPETPKLRRSRKSASSLVANDNKANSEQKSPHLPRKRKKENATTDGRSTPNATRGRRIPLETAAVEEEITELAKTPPPSGQKAKKAFLEKELEDILENATGRNTPSMSRRKLNEKEDENFEGEKLARTRKTALDGLDGLEEKGGFFLPKPRKGNDKEVDDDNLSVRSFSTFLRARKNFDKEIDDDVLSVRSMSVRSKKGDLNEDDTISVKSLPRPKKVKKVERKKKAVVSPTIKKKVLLKKARASPKKGSDIKGKKLQKKKPKVKAINKDSASGKEKKKVIKKPLNIQTKKKAQKRLQTALLIKKQRLKKPKSPNEKTPRGRKKQKAAVSPKEENAGNEKADVTVEHVKNETERLKIEHASVRPEVAEPVKEVPIEGIKKGGKAVSNAEPGAKAKPRGRQIKNKANPVGMTAGKKRRRESNIHFEMTPCPDDSEVIIVQPRLGPRKKTNRTKKTAPETPKPAAKRVKKKNVTTSMLPMGNNALPATVTNYSTISTPYILPNYNLLGNNQSIVRNFNSNATVSPNFDLAKPVGQSNLPYLDEPNAYGPKVSSNEILITQTGIMLSGGRIVPSANQHPSNSNVRFPNSSPGFVPDNGVMYPSQKPLENSSLIYQNSTNVIQPQSCPTTNTAMLIKKPESMSTSLISTTAGTIVISPSGNVNNLSDISLLKPQTGFTASTQTDTIMSEKALEGDTQTAENISILNRYRNVPRIENLPTIPVAKSVNDLLLLKSKSEMQMANDAKTEINQIKSYEDVPKDSIKGDSETPKKVKEKKKPTERRKRRVLRNVRINQGSASELTFSEPETCFNEAEEMERLYKTISCERLLNPHKPSGIYNVDPRQIYEFGSEPITISDAITPFETASSFSLPKKEIMENKIDIDKINGMDFIMTSPKAKEAAEVCSFSKENEEALKELGLDSDMDQTKSEGDIDSPRAGNATNKANEDVDRVSKKAKLKVEVDHVLREMPIRRIPNLYRRTDCNRSPQNRLEMKNPLVVKNNEYLSKSPVKAPTVIDKLLEKNKSLKKAEQEGKFQNSVRNLSENFDKYEEKPIKKSSKEMRSRKFTKDMESRRVASKKFANDSSSVKIFERRGSNPEIYSNDYQVSNENLPLRRVTDPGDKFQRRSSIDYDSIQKVIDRRCSLPEDSDKVKIPKNAENVNKLKTENIKTIVVGSCSNVTSKNRGADGKPRIINIVTSDDGSKKGQNLMDEIGMDALENCYVNGDKSGRRTSVESCNSETENIKKLMDGLSDINSDGKLSKEVPYCEGKSSRKLKGSDRRKDEQKSAIADESPEDLATKETILSALGLQSLKAAAQNAQKKKENHLVCQSDSVGYTGTLKTVIKIQRQEKKGSSKAPLKMIYKASSSNLTASVVTEETNNLEPEIEMATKEDAEESPSEDNKNGNGKAKSLVIPEKASSFSIHPGRMCSDVCTYCFGKFGLLDTPCHIAQLKDADKRRNILAAEVHLTADSCLCDACFRHVDKKSNCPTFTDKKPQRKVPTRKQICCVQNCNADSQHSVRRKSFLKLKKSIGRKIILDPAKLEKLQPVHLVTLCHRHIYWIDYFMSCGICKKRLTSVNMYRVGPDVNELNAALSADGIPTILTEKRFLCKICHCYASIRIKCKEPSEMSSNQCQFYENYRKRILQCHGIDVPDSEAEENDNSHETKSTKTKNKKAPKPTATITNDISKSDKSDNEADGSAEESTKTFEKGKDSEVKEATHMNIPPKTNGNLDFGGVTIAPTTTEVNPTQIHVKLGNLNIGALGNLNIGQDVRHGSRPGDIQCFPTETELALRAHFDLNPSAEDQSSKVPRKGFEKCTTTIQFNEETKNLFYNLQMPYGNNSSFFRHLILLEKYFRSGDLVIGRNADPKAVNYISSVQNRIRSYEGIHNPPPAPAPAPAPLPPTPVKKSMDIPPSLSIVPQPAKSETRGHETKSSVIPSRPFTLTPMPSTASLASFSKTSPLSQIQATVQNIPTPSNPNLNQGIMGSFLKSVNQHSPKATTSHPKPEISITSVPNDSPSTRNPNKSTVSAPNPPYLTSKLQENLKKLATKMQNSKPSNQARAVILNRTIGGQKQSLVQVTTGGKTIHLTLTQFRRIQQMQIRKKQYMEHQAKLQRQKDESKTSTKSTDDDDDDDIDIKHLSPELEIQELKQKTNGNEVFPIISDVRTLSGEDSSWDKKSDSNDGQPSESFPKIPKTLSVSVTKIPPPDYSFKEQSVDPVE